MNILITGADGVIGKEIVNELQKIKKWKEKIIGFRFSKIRLA